MSREYFCHIDESGDPANPLDENNNMILRSSTVYTLAGIFTDKTTKEKMEEEHKKIIEKYFSTTQLASDFYLHYNPLRQNEPPYDILSSNDKLRLITDIFSVIKNSDCVLFSISLDLEGHYKKYSVPLNPQAYTLTLFCERILSYMGKNNIPSVKVEYEKFNHALRDKCIKSFKQTTRFTNFRTRLDVPKCLKVIHDGDPCKSPLLQYADFWAFIPYSKMRSKLDFNKFKNNFKLNSMNKGQDGNYFIYY